MGGLEGDDRGEPNDDRGEPIDDDEEGEDDVAPPPATSQEQVTCATDGVPINGIVTQDHPLQTLRAEPTGSINDQGERSAVAPGRGGEW